MHNTLSGHLRGRRMRRWFLAACYEGNLTISGRKRHSEIWVLCLGRRGWWDNADPRNIWFTDVKHLGWSLRYPITNYQMAEKQLITFPSIMFMIKKKHYIILKCIGPTRNINDTTWHNFPYKNAFWKSASFKQWLIRLVFKMLIKSIWNCHY